MLRRRPLARLARAALRAATHLVVLGAATLLLACEVGEAPAPARAATGELPAREAARVVSLNPSVTAILLALGAETSLVGVDEYSAQLEPRVRELPRVGGLFNPSLEAILGVEPSFVALVPSAQQHDLQQRLAELGVEVLALPNISYAEVLRSIEVLGERVGRPGPARERVAAIRRSWRESREGRASQRPPPRAVLVLQRDPLYVVGGGSFIDTMLGAAGLENPASAFAEPYPRVSIEWLIDAAPEWILDAADPPAEAVGHWSRWPSLPAVAQGRVRAIDQRIILPGPDLDRSLERLVAHLEGGAG